MVNMIELITFQSHNRYHIYLTGNQQSGCLHITLSLGVKTHRMTEMQQRTTNITISAGHTEHHIPQADNIIQTVNHKQHRDDGSCLCEMIHSHNTPSHLTVTLRDGICVKSKNTPSHTQRVLSMGLSPCGNIDGHVTEG